VSQRPAPCGFPEPQGCRGREGRQPPEFADFGTVLGCTDPPGAVRGKSGWHAPPRRRAASGLGLTHVARTPPVLQQCSWPRVPRTPPKSGASRSSATQRSPWPAPPNASGRRRSLSAQRRAPYDSPRGRGESRGNGPDKFSVMAWCCHRHGMRLTDHAHPAWRSGVSVGAVLPVGPSSRGALKPSSAVREKNGESGSFL
jgi:hypothetical protein